MSTIEQIKTAILSLAPEEFQQLRQWFADVDYQHWDEQLKQDISDGKLDDLAEEAILELKAGATYPIWSPFNSHEAAHQLAQLLELE
jgi:hypothetical protein